jgi:hypothetical protein
MTKIQDIEKKKHIQEVGNPLTGLTLPPFSVCPKPGPGFPTSYVLGLIVLSDFS